MLFVMWAKRQVSLTKRRSSPDSNYSFKECLKKKGRVKDPAIFSAYGAKSNQSIPPRHKVGVMTPHSIDLAFRIIVTKALAI